MNIFTIQGHIFQESWCFLPITKHPVIFSGFNNASARASENYP